MTRKKFSFATIILILIFVILAVLIVYSLRKTEIGSDSSNGNYKLEDDRPDIVFESFDHTVFDGDTKKFRIKAVKLKGFLSEGKYILEEIEKAVFWHEDGSVITGTSDSGIFEEKTGNVSLSGNVSIVIQKPGETDVSTFTAQDLHYSNIDETFITEGPVQIIQTGFQASGRGMKLDQVKKSVWLKSEVKTKTLYFQESSQSEVPLDISAGHALYLHDQSRIHYTEDVIVKSGNNFLKCGELHLFLDENENRIECLGAVEASFLPSEENPSGSSSDISEKSLPVIVRADELIIYRLSRRMTATGNVIISQGNQILSADFTELFYGENESGITAVEAIGKVKVQDPDKTLTGEKLLYSLVSDRIIITGKPVMTSEKDTISGDTFILHPDRGYFAIRGGIKGRIYPKSTGSNNKQMAGKLTSENNGKSAPVTFSAEQGDFDEQSLSGFLQENVVIKQELSTLYAEKAVFLLNDKKELQEMHASGGVKAINEDQNFFCDELMFNENMRQASLKGNCRIWKGESFIEAPEVVIFIDLDELQAQNGVLTHFEGSFDLSGKENKKKDEAAGLSIFNGYPLDITSNSLFYSKKQNLMKFREDVNVSKSGKTEGDDFISCDELDVKLSQNDQGFEEMFAKGSFVMTQKTDMGKRWIKSDTALYRSKEDILTVEGKKVQITDPQNSIICRKADFYIARKIYIIEGQQATAIHYPEGYRADQKKFQDPDSSSMQSQQRGPSRSSEQQDTSSGQRKPPVGRK